MTASLQAVFPHSRSRSRRPALEPIAIAGVLLLGALNLPGAEPAPDRPCVGLVLSGGSALGMAHVGVLKVLEELRVPVCCVAGTSMGAIVGGMYAAGMSPAEMEQFLVEADWRDLLTDRPPRRQMPYRRKQDDLTYLTRFELGFNHGSFQLPVGLVAGQKFGFLLQAMTLHTVGLDSFDDLPIPFRTVATDLETGEMVVLRDGNLASSIRASMSIPGVFSPVEIDGRLLVDGGLVLNLPVDLALEMGADVIIAVDVGTPLQDRGRLGSLVKISSQIVNMTIRRNVENQIPKTDILIEPGLDDFHSADFERAAEIIPQGEEAARAVADRLAEYSVAEDSFASYLERVRHREPVTGTITSVQLSLSATTDAERVMRKIRTRPGDPLDVEAIRRDLQRLYSLGDYELVSFRLAPDQDGYVLFITAREKSWGPNFLRFGLNLSADLQGSSSFALLTSYTMTDLNRLRGEAKFEVQIGEDPTFFAELYQPLTAKGRFFVATWGEQGRTSAATTIPGDQPEGYRVRLLRGGLDLGLDLGRWGEVRFGVTGGGGQASPTFRPQPEPPEPAVEWGGYRLRGVLDQLDNPNFPREGVAGVVEIFAGREALGSETSYERLEINLAGVRSWGRHTVLGSAFVGTTLGGTLPFYDRYRLGGLFRLSGYGLNSVTGQYGGITSAMYYVRVASLAPAVGGGVFAGLSLEAGNAWEERSQASLTDLRYAASAFLGADTLFGPVYVAYGHGDDGSDAFYFFVGRSF